MLSASGGLAFEGVSLELNAVHNPVWHVCAGIALGVAFMLATKGFLETHEHLKFSGLSSTFL